MDEVRDEAKALALDVTWASTAEYLEHLRRAGTAVNVVPLVDHNTVPGAVLGFDDVQPISGAAGRDVEAGGADVKQEAEELSSGLFYPLGFHARSDEVIELARFPARHGGRSQRARPIPNCLQPKSL